MLICGGPLFCRALSTTTPRALVPIVLDNAQSGGERAYDIYSRLLKDRIVCLHGPIVSFTLPPSADFCLPPCRRQHNVTNKLAFSRHYISHCYLRKDDTTSSVITSQLLYLDLECKPIHLYINSPGGAVTAGLAIYDTMQYISSPVHTLCMGQAASMGSLILAGGEKGHRFILPNSRVMMHQPSGGFQGTATDMHIQAEEIVKLRNQMNKLYSDHTGQNVDVVEITMDRDKYFSAEEAVEFGICDEIMRQRCPPPPST